MDDKDQVKLEVNKTLKQENSKAINMYYRTEGTFTFSFIGLLLCIFWWENITQVVYFFVGGMIFQFLFMMFFIYKHFKSKGIV